MTIEIPIQFRKREFRFVLLDRESKRPIENNDESSADDEMFRKWDKNYFDGVEENDLDKEEGLKEQNNEEEKEEWFWGYERPQKEEFVDDDVSDGMSIW